MTMHYTSVRRKMAKKIFSLRDIYKQVLVTLNIIMTLMTVCTESGQNILPVRRIKTVSYNMRHVTRKILYLYLAWPTKVGTLQQK